MLKTTIRSTKNCRIKIIVDTPEMVEEKTNIFLSSEDIYIEDISFLQRSSGWIQCTILYHPIEYDD